MDPRRKGYSSLDELYLERDAVLWYWRIAALAASWLILGGYLILPTTFDSDPELRFSRGGVDAIIAIFLIVGYALTVVLYFAVPNWLFQAESIFYPTLCSSAFGLIGTLYAFASSPRYKFKSSAGITVALTSASTALFAVLLFFTQRKVARVRVGVTAYEAGAGITVLAEEPPQDGRQSQSSTAGLYQDASYYRNYIANMHPTAIRAPSHDDDGRLGRFDTLREQPSYHSLRDPSPSPTRAPGGASGSTTSIGFYDPPPHLGGGGGGSGSNNRSTPDLPAPPSPAQHPQIGEEEQVSQHLARLLLNTRDGGGPGGANASQTTFRIDWRSEDDEDSPRSGIQMRTRTGSGSRLVPPGKIAQVAVAQAQAQQQQMAPPLARLAPHRGGDGAGSRNADGSGSGGHRRTKSRDDRRREIELGFVGQQQPPASGGSR